MHLFIVFQLIGFSSFAHSLQMLISIYSGHKKVKTSPLNVYRRQQQYIHSHCQLNCVTPGSAVLVSVCILMIPALGLAAEHLHLATTDSINQFHDYQSHMTFRHAPLVMPFLNDVLPAMVLQKRIVRSKIRSPLSSNSSFASLGLFPVPLRLGRVVGIVVRVVVVLLLLLMSGDVELNPGPAGEYFVVLM